MRQDCHHDPLPLQNTTEEGTALSTTLTDSKTEREDLGHHAAPLAVLAPKSILISPAMSAMRRPVGTTGVGVTQTGMTGDMTGDEPPLIMTIGPEPAGREVGVDHQFAIGRGTESGICIGGRATDSILGRSPSLPSGDQQGWRQIQEASITHPNIKQGGREILGVVIRSQIPNRAGWE